MPPKTNPWAIASLVAALAPLVTLIMPQVGVFASGVGAILGIVFGIVALGQIKREPQRWTGRGLAVAGIAVGIVEIVVAIVIVVIAILFVAALAAACASCGSGGAKFGWAGLALRGRLPRDRVLRFATSHHPACGLYEADTVDVLGHPVCVGCATSMPVAALGFVALHAFVPPTAWAACVVLGLALGGVQLFSVAGLTRTRGSKVLVKALAGVATALVVYGLVVAPWSWPVRFVALAGAWLLALALVLPRARRIDAECAAAGHVRDAAHG